MQCKVTAPDGTVTTYSRTWAIPKGMNPVLAKKTAELKAEQFDTECREGKALTRKEQKEASKKQAEEDKKRQLGNMSFRDFFFKKFYPENSSIYKSNTLKNYTVFVHVLPVEFAGTKLCDITINELNNVVKELFEHYAYISACQYFSKIKVILEYAMYVGAIDENPTKRVKLPQKNKDLNLPMDEKALTRDQIKLLLIAAKNATRTKWFYPFACVALDTGCRIGEILSLKWENVDFHSGKIIVTSQWCKAALYSSGNGLIPPKYDSYRVLSVSPKTVEILASWKQENEEQEWVFPGYKSPNFPLNPTSVERKFTYISEKLGFRVTAHMLRHTSASIAIEQGAPPPCVAERLGHSKIETTINVYTHPSSDCEAKVGAILAGVLDGLETHQEEYER